MYKYSKLALKIFIIVNILMWGYFLLTTYIYDPLQIWHQPYFRGLTYVDNNREINKAIIRDNNFDSIIIGSSVSANTSAEEASRKLHSVFMNLSMYGSPPPENKIILDYVLKHKEIKNIIYFLTVRYLDLSKENIHWSLKSYSFLYDDNKYNDYQIYFNYKYLRCMITLSKSHTCIGQKLNMDKPYAWEDKKKCTSRFGGFNKWLASKDNKPMTEVFDLIFRTSLEITNQNISEAQKIEIIKYLNENITDIIKNNPKVQFYLVLSPIASLELARDIRTDDMINFARQKFALKYLASENEKYNNLKIFAFDNLDTIGNIQDFADNLHYKSWINSFILDSISKNKNIINSKNVDNYISQTYKKAVSYNYNYYFNKINNIKKSTLHSN